MTWEERMAAKAKKRADERKALWREESDKDWQLTQQEYIDTYLENYMPDMTVEEAQEFIRHPSAVGCACMGGPTCCIVAWQAITRLAES